MNIEEDTPRLQKEIESKLAIKPNEIELLIDLGIIEFWYHSDPEAALAHFKKAAEIDPQNIRAKFWLANCLYIYFLEYEEAINILNEALKLDPNSPECLSKMAWILDENDDPVDLSIQYVHKAIKNAPDWPKLRLQLASLYLKKKDVKQAEEQVNIALTTLVVCPPIDNIITSYYENIVTGRAYKDIKRKFERVIADIEWEKNQINKKE